MTASNPSPVEDIKAASNLLRGTLIDSLADPLTGAIAEDDTQVSKFHGIYQQDDRDVRPERRQQKLEPAYSFMIRVRVPGGTLTSAQWLALHALAERYANGALRITTRQALQFHGVLKQDLKPTIAAINATLLDTFAACGDVNRNVMGTAVCDSRAVYDEVQKRVREVSDRLTPSTRAYHEIWLDGEKLTTPEAEPVYGATYLPRKFKISFAIPPTNDTDVYAQDLGFIAVVDGDRVRGFNVTVGGGMGMTHGDADTYPRVADVIGFCTSAQVLDVAEAVVTTQRDYGNRSDRKRARLKYTIDERGLEWFIAEVERRCGFDLGPPAPVVFDRNHDRFRWWQDDGGRHHLGLFVPGGRVTDTPQRGAGRWFTGLAELAGAGRCEFRLTPNQNLVVADVAEQDRALVSATVAAHGMGEYTQVKPTRRDALACVALPTCGLAMAEAERYLPDFLDAVETTLRAHGLQDETISLRMTGCPNGCARPYLADVGLVGRAPGRYTLRLGGGDAGRRLNQVYRDNLSETEILAALDELFGRFVRERQPGESFGGWTTRAVMQSGSAA